MVKKRFVLFLVLVIALVFIGIYFLWGNTMFFKKTYSYTTSGETFTNPYIGYAVMAEDMEYEDVSELVYIDVTWKELEPEEGVYDWESIYESNHIEEWKAAGKHAVFRFLCDYPTSEAHRDIPDWLYDLTGDGTDYDIEYGKGYSPNYSNETFIAYHQKVMEEIGRELGSDTFVSYVELGSLGHWGEWHVYYPAGITRMPTTEIRAQYVEHYVEAFPNAKLLMRRPFAELPEGAGVYNDMTGDPDSTYEFLDWIENGGDYSQAQEENGLVAVPDIWESAPVGGEFTSGITMDVLLGDDLEETISLLEETHMSFIGPKTPELSADNENYETALSLMQYIGYRYTVTEATMQKQFFKNEYEIKIQLKNIGVAPTYWDFTPCLYVESKDGTIERYAFDVDLKELQQDEEITLTTTLSLAKESGTKIWFGIEDDDTGNTDISLDLDTEEMDGKYFICSRD